jgi:hypothetical protein
MGIRLTALAYQINVGDAVRHKSGDIRLVVVEIILAGHAAWCEIRHGEQAGLMMIHKMRDLVPIGTLH